MEFFGISGPEAVVLLVVALLVLGPAGMRSLARRLLVWRARWVALRERMEAEVRAVLPGEGEAR